MKKKMAQRRPWFLWIGGACFLVGSIVAGSIGLAASAAPSGPTVDQGAPGTSPWPVSAAQSGTWQQEITDGTHVLGTSTNPLRTDPTGTTTQPVSGTVTVAAPSETAGDTTCTVPNGSNFCNTGDVGLATGTVMNTVSVHCQVSSGQHFTVEVDAGGFSFLVPVTFQETLTGNDIYVGTLTNLAIPAVTSNTAFSMTEDYVASTSLPGVSCNIDFVSTSS
jgi:hypothetical protein